MSVSLRPVPGMSVAMASAPACPSPVQTLRHPLGCPVRADDEHVGAASSGEKSSALRALHVSRAPISPAISGGWGVPTRSSSGRGRSGAARSNPKASTMSMTPFGRVTWPTNSSTKRSSGTPSSCRSAARSSGGRNRSRSTPPTMVQVTGVKRGEPGKRAESRPSTDEAVGRRSGRGRDGRPCERTNIQLGGGCRAWRART